jgi:hypothetical protein
MILKLCPGQPEPVVLELMDNAQPLATGRNKNSGVGVRRGWANVFVLNHTISHPSHLHERIQQIGDGDDMVKQKACWSTILATPAAVSLHMPGDPRDLQEDEIIEIHDSFFLPAQNIVISG